MRDEKGQAVSYQPSAVSEGGPDLTDSRWPTADSPSSSLIPHPSSLDLSVIIVTWNTRELLAACLAALPAAIGDLTAETWVVDNASSDGTVAMVRERFPDVHVLANRE